MGKSRNRHIQPSALSSVHQNSGKTFDIRLIIEIITLAVLLVGSAYSIGRNQMASEKDKEMIRREIEYENLFHEQERQYRKELDDKGTEVDEWKEKYFKVIRIEDANTGRSEIKDQLQREDTS